MKRGPCTLKPEPYHINDFAFTKSTRPGGNPGANLRSNLPQMLPLRDSICMRVDQSNYRFASGLPLRWGSAWPTRVTISQLII